VTIAFDPATLEAVSETLFLPLYALALGSQQEDPILVDEEAVALTEELNKAFAGSDKRIYKKLVAGRLPKTLLTTLPLRVRHFDEVTRDFLARQPDGNVVSLGCGLSNRRRRVDNGRARWFNLDLPPVIELRAQCIDDDDERVRSIPASVLDFAWMDELPGDPGARFLFLAEGLLPYLEANDVRALVVRLRDRFPGAELVAEMGLRRVVELTKGRLGRGKLRRQFGFSEDVYFRSGIEGPEEVEGWAEGIEVIDDWDTFDEDEPRLNWMRPFTRWKLFRRAVFVPRWRLGPP
jgi:O-methyltransferase involved in polyketide biosynthesis